MVEEKQAYQSCLLEVLLFQTPPLSGVMGAHRQFIGAGILDQNNTERKNNASRFCHSLNGYTYITPWPPGERLYDSDQVYFCRINRDIVQ